MIDPDVIGQIEQAADPKSAKRSTDQCPHPTCGRRIEDRFLAFRMRNALNTMALLLVAATLAWTGWAYKEQRAEFTSMKDTISKLQSAQLTTISAQYEGLRSVLDEYNRVSHKVLNIEMCIGDLQKRVEKLEKLR